MAAYAATTRRVWKKIIPNPADETPRMTRIGTVFIQGGSLFRAHARTWEKIKHLDDFLGEDHDLALLSEKMRGFKSGSNNFQNSCQEILTAICHGRAKLQRRAIILGNDFLKNGPGFSCVELSARRSFNLNVTLLPLSRVGPRVNQRTCIQKFWSWMTKET